MSSKKLIMLMMFWTNSARKTLMSNANLPIDDTNVVDRLCASADGALYRWRKEGFTWHPKDL